MQIRKSAEDYLEAILVLSKQGGGVRSIDDAWGIETECESCDEAVT